MGHNARMSNRTYRVTEIRGHIREGAVDHVQVGMKVGFRLEDS